MDHRGEKLEALQKRDFNHDALITVSSWSNDVREKGMGEGIVAVQASLGKHPGTLYLMYALSPSLQRLGVHRSHVPQYNKQDLTYQSAS